MQSYATIETFIDLLKQGKNVIHTAEGYSMFPKLRPGDKVLVIPINENNIPEPGSLVVAMRDNRLVLHRLIEIHHDATGNKLFITRGDSMAETDFPWQYDQLIGVIDLYDRKEKERVVSRKMFSEKRYKMNRAMLWVWLKIRRLKRLKKI